MRYEIEVKAHCTPSHELERALEAECRYLGPVDKSDRYFLFPGAQAGEDRNFRIRTEAGASMVTWKSRRRLGVMEVNQEREFPISEPDAFLELCLAMGASEYFRKTKKGRAYGCGEWTVELVEVEPLGYFLEIELLVECPQEGPEPSLVSSTKEAMLEFLGRLGVATDHVEESSYSALIRSRSLGLG